MKFYTSDLHFYHKNIIAYENRPFKTVEEMNAKLIENWNSVVGKNDEVYILGDFAFCNGIMANELLSALKGRKYLVKGNHDTFLKYKTFDISLFEWVKDYAKISDYNTKIILFHYPIAVWDSKHHGSLHFYGHVHSNEKTSHPLTNPQENSYNVGVDVNDFTPKTFKQIVGR